MAKIYLGNSLINTSTLGPKIIGIKYLPITTTNYLLQENADFLLQEDGFKIEL